MKILNFKFQIILLLLATCYLILATDAKAQAFHLAIDPPILQIEAKPPANVLAPFSVENLSNQPVELNIVLKPFEPSDQENGQIRYLEEIPPGYTSIFQRVRVLDPSASSGQVTKLTLGPKQKKDLTLNINLPRDAEVSDYYFSIIFKSAFDTFDTSPTSGTLISGGIAVNVLLSTGEKQTKGLIQEFSAPLFLEKGPVPFTVRVKNTGIHYIAPVGEIIIKNLLGQTTGKVNLQPVNILAGSVRSIPSSDASDTFDTFAAFDTFLLGPYKATLNLALSENGPQFSEDLIFFAFPGITILVVLGSLILLLYLFLRVRSRV